MCRWIYSRSCGELQEDFAAGLLELSRAVLWINVTGWRRSGVRLPVLRCSRRCAGRKIYKQKNLIRAGTYSWSLDFFFLYLDLDISASLIGSAGTLLVIGQS